MYAPDLLNYGRKVTHDVALIEDSIHDLFIELWQSRANLTDTNSIKLYLVRSLRNKINRTRSRDPFFQASDIDALTGNVDDMGIEEKLIYRPIHADDLLENPRTGRSQSQINYMVFRYADVLLMYAEAQNEAVGPDASVYSALNLIRSRAGVAAVTPGLTKDQMRAEIRHERRIELAGEGLYYHDIQRWRTAEVVMNTDIFNFDGKKPGFRTFNKDRDYLWPIPTIVTQLNPNLTQNPGYRK